MLNTYDFRCSMFSRNCCYVLEYCCFSLIYLQKGFDKAMKVYTDKANARVSMFSDRLINSEKRIEAVEEKFAEMASNIKLLLKGGKQHRGAVASNIISDS